ncbi:MAG: peptide/nickel transport system substrate-binding protein [Candidatus Peregrinibacteria bacterium Greene0416_19]|nr:MAG: peptide/nickel transport system substrate-binding protein [Candidatus Peregrinibacteria bacterium Greene0416_19]
MSRPERWALATLLSLALVSGTGLVHTFYMDNTVVVPTTGGTYIEGSVGLLQPLNPWFTVQNDVHRDIVSLVFAGLLRYNPQSRRIEDDLATMKVSSDGKTYTLTLKEQLFWHDSTPDNPHPVTVEDVLFTFRTIQEPGFPNQLLAQNFRGVNVTKVDDRAVRFALAQPYGFFPSNLTIGLLPKDAFTGIPVGKLDQALDFGFKPVGAGPYRFKGVVQTDVSSEITLERFPRALPPEYHLDRIVFRIFPDYSTLLGDLRTLQGVRLVPRNRDGDPLIPKRFRARTYTLPQYVALFFNLDRRALQDEKLRLGLQLGTDKQTIADSIHQPLIVDTPLLEIDVSDWRYQFDLTAAQGALFASRWHLPEKLRLQRLLEQDEANKAGGFRTEPVVYLETGAALSLSGSLAAIGAGTRINGIALVRHRTGTGTWAVAIPTAGGTGTLKIGENLLRMTDDRGRTVDSFYLQRFASRDQYQRAMEERRLVIAFLQGRGGTVPAQDRITPERLFLDRGFLRLRRGEDPVSARRNDRDEPLQLTLLTSGAPPEYRQVAEQMQEQWARLGVQVTIEIPASRDALQERLLRRDYDLVLFGQSLLDNLDSYPYWHSSGMQKLTGNAGDLRRDAYNLSQYVSFKADSLLDTVRRTGNEKERTDALKQLRDVLKQDVPAIFLYSPVYTFAHHQRIRGIDLGSLSLHSDRFLTLSQWYVKEHRQFVEGKNWWSLFPWLRSLIEG